MRSELGKKIAYTLALIACSNISLANAAESLDGSQVESKQCISADDKSCKISCVDPHACCAESEKVLDVLQQLVKAYSSGNLKTYEEYLDESCTTFDENTHKLISGKNNVMSDLKAKFERYAPNGPTPLLSFTIDHPYAKVSGDTAVVTFIAFREVGGKHPYKEKCNVTDIFIKHGDSWKKMHYRGAWKRA